MMRDSGDTTSGAMSTRGAMSADTRAAPHAPAAQEGFADVLPGPFQAGMIRIRLEGEELVVRPEAVVTGEVAIQKERLVERQELTETLRRWEAVPREERTDQAGVAAVSAAA
jgi:stress response protein YsnF